MSVVSALRKKMVTGSSIDELEQRIATVKREAAEACAAAEQAQAQVAGAQSFEAAQQFEEAARRARWTVGHADRVLAELEADLARLKDAARREKIMRRQAALSGAYGKLREALLVAAAIQAEVIAERRAAEAELGGQDADLFLPIITFRGLLLPDLVQRWTHQTDKAVAALRTPAPVAIPAKAPREQTAAAPDSQRQVATMGTATRGDAPPAQPWAHSVAKTGG